MKENEGNSSTISMILFRNVSLPSGKSTTRFGVSPFFLRKVTIFIGRETKHTFYRRKFTKKIGQVGLFIDDYSFRSGMAIQQRHSVAILAQI